MACSDYLEYADADPDAGPRVWNTPPEETTSAPSYIGFSVNV